MREMLGYVGTARWRCRARARARAREQNERVCYFGKQEIGSGFSLFGGNRNYEQSLERVALSFSSIVERSVTRSRQKGDGGSLRGETFARLIY